MSEWGWQPMRYAPRDGTWLLLEGEFDGGDTSSTRIGRWEPRGFETGVYEWRVFEQVHDGIDGCALPKWNWYSGGRVCGWLSLPAKAIEARRAATGNTDAVEDESAVRDSEFAQEVSTNKLSMRRGGE